MGIVDRELAAVAVEREETSRRLNSKRMNHIATLRELGEYFTCPFDRFVSFPEQICLELQGDHSQW